MIDLAVNDSVDEDETISPVDSAGLEPIAESEPLVASSAPKVTPMAAEPLLLPDAAPDVNPLSAGAPLGDPTPVANPVPAPDPREKWKNTESLVFDFNGWFSGQDKETRSFLIQYLSRFSDADRATEKVRLVNMYAVADLMDMDLDDVAKRWDSLRTRIAMDADGDWGLHPNEVKFNQLLQQKVAQRRDTHWLVEGKEDDPQSQADSLARLTFDAAAMEQPATSALIEWDRRARGKAGYAVVDQDAMKRMSTEFHSEASARLAPVLPMAKEAFLAITSGEDLENYSERLIERFVALEPRQQRDFLAVLRIKADAASDKDRATFWGNLNKATGRALGSTGRGVADAGSAWLEMWKLAIAVEVPFMDAGEQIESTGRKLAEHDLESDLRRIQEQNFSPIREVMGDYMPGWLERGIYGIPQAVSTTLLAAVPYAGLPATFGSMVSQSYEEERFRLLDAGLSREQASARAAILAPIIAVPNAALEKLGASAVLGKLPMLKSALLKLGDKVGGGVFGYGVRTLGHGTSELFTEGAQGLMTPLVESVAAALDKDMPEVVWRNGKDGVLDGLWSKSAETFVSLLPLALIGAAESGHSRVQTIHGASDLDLRAFGAREEDIVAFRLAAQQGPLSAQDAAETLLANRDANSETARAAIAEITSRERHRVADNSVQLRRDMEEAGVRGLVRGENGWALVHPDGEQTRAGSEESARAMVSDLKQAAAEREAQASHDVIKRWAEAPIEAESRDASNANGQQIRDRSESPVIRRVTSEGELQRLRERARVDAEASGNTEIDAAINGSNWVGKVGHSTRELIRRTERGESASASLNFLRETAGSDWRRGVRRGAITLEETQRAIGAVAKALDAKTVRSEGEHSLRERLRRASRGEASEVQLRETLSELAVADVLGNQRDSSQMRAGSVTAALDTALQQAVNPTEVREIGKMRGFFRSVRDNVRAVFGAMSALNEARSDGGTQGYDVLVSKLFGNDWQAAKEWAESSDVSAMGGTEVDSSAMDHALGAEPGDLGDIGENGLSNMDLSPAGSADAEGYADYSMGMWSKLTGAARGLVIAAQAEVAAMQRELAKLRETLNGPEAKNRSNAETRKLLTRMNELKTAVVKRAREVFKIPKNQRGGKTITLPDTFDLSLGTLPFDAASMIEEFVNPNLLPTIKEVIKREGREGHSDGKIYIEPNSHLATVIHEMMHAVEQQNPAVLTACRAFLAERAARGVRKEPQQLTKLTGDARYKEHEVAYEDEWVLHGGHPYSGKVCYHGTEILTTGFERFLKDPLRFAQTDPEYFSFIVNLVRP